jgi:hypothetical protein
MEEGELLISVKIQVTPQYPAERFEEFIKFFGDSLQKMHRASSFFILELCIRWTRVDKGRLRAGWIPYLNDHGFPWQRSATKVRNETLASISEGMAVSRYQEGYLQLYVENGVNYAGYLNDSDAGIFDVSGTHSVQPALFSDVQGAGAFFGKLYADKMEKLLANCDMWLEEVMKNGDTGKIDVPDDLGPPNSTDL